MGSAAATLVVIVGLFALAWVVSRFASRAAAAFVDRSERRRAPAADTAVMVSLRQRETAIALLQTSIRYFVYALALVLSIAALAGAHKLQTIVGASFLAIVIAFAAQRFLMDVIAGLLMFFEGWFRIGDAVAIDPLHVEGVVEAVSLRSLTLRSVTGEIQYVPNSQVTALRRLPRGYRELEIEFFAHSLEGGRKLVEEIARLVPAGPTRFVRRPEVVDTETLGEDLHRIDARAAVVFGREWLAEEFLPALIRERAPEGLLVHGPVITYLDETAAHSFARAVATPPPRDSKAGRGSSHRWGL